MSGYSIGFLILFSTNKISTKCDTMRIQGEPRGAIARVR